MGSFPLASTWRKADNPAEGERRTDRGGLGGRVEVFALAVAAIVLLYLLGGCSKKRPGDTIQGWAKVTDGDGIKVKGYRVRLAGLDAPEWNQPAQHRYGFWFNHGKWVKRALSRELAGRRVQVKVEGYDRYDRVLGTVSCRGRDVGEWLVRSGHAIACFDSRYKAAESEARSERRGMWGYDQAYDPRAWRRR